ncbi:hypothetical protein AVEN_159521-1 [Araneus ventricosus]|uniref:Uncharacterized protein n=1 Tax=Araneus ventricosus TaxID=182803 RepID=A0A4Y2A1A4_ARAVE|nr:hypothetical protein AVEN_159521-1 [Araneus ventricosus]
MRSNGLSFHELHLRFALFPVVGTGRIYVARGLVSASVVSRILAVNKTHIKGKRPGQTAPFPDSTSVCSKFDFDLILSCHGEFDASNLKRTCHKFAVTTRATLACKTRLPQVRRDKPHVCKTSLAQRDN